MSTVIFLTFLFAVMETAFALYSYFFLAEAAREGARYAIVRGSTAGGGAACASYSSSNCQASAANIESYIQNLGFPGISASNMTVPAPAWSAYASGSPCPSSPNPCNSPGNLVTVTVRYNFPLAVPFIPAHTFSMSSSASMIISQ